MLSLQGSLFDAVDAPSAVWRPLDAAHRTVLTAGAWVDHLPGWLAGGPEGADGLFERLTADVPWRAERRQMYDREVDVPRLLSFYGEDDTLPDPLLTEARARLSAAQPAGDSGHGADRAAPETAADEPPDEEDEP